MRVGRLIVVRHGAREAKYGCLVPDCGAKFYDGEERAFERHCVECADRNHAKVVAQSMRNRAPDLFDPLSDRYNGDVDLDRWIRKHRQAIIDQRVKM